MDFAQQLAEFVRSIARINLEKTIDIGYTHMGAIITDAILQAGLNYKTVVAPRVKYILETYPEAVTTAGFLHILDTHGRLEVLQWKHPEKPNRVYALTTFLSQQSLNTHDDLRIWLMEPHHSESLRSIKGIGPKTIDYLKNLVQIPTVAVDRHIRGFLIKAGIVLQSYEDIRLVVEQAAELLNVSPAQLDHAIWRYMSNNE